MKLTRLLCAAVLLNGCASSTTPDEVFETPGHLTLVNALSSGANATLMLDGEVASLPEAGTSIGFPIEIGTHHLKVQSSAGMQEIAFVVAQGAYHIAVIANSVSSGAMLVMGREPSDTASKPPASGAKIRAVSLAEGQPDFDTYLYPAGGSIDSSTKFVHPFRYGVGTDSRFPGYAVRPVGTYRFRVATAGSVAAIVESDPIVLGEHQVWSVVLSRKTDGGLMLQAVRDNMEQLR